MNKVFYFRYMDLERIYFSTATILRWQMLLKPVKYKKIIIDCLSDLARNKKIQLYGLVIMPNHIHIIWELLDMNGKEMPHASFFKYTSHVIQKDFEKTSSYAIGAVQGKLGTEKLPILAAGFIIY
jgi:putative transposase